MQQPITDAFEVYLDRSDLRPNSVRAKRQALRFFVKWFGDLPIGHVSCAIAEDFRAMLAKGRTQASANTYLDVFAPFWRWLFRHGRIQQNPFEGLARYKTDRKPPQQFELMDLERMVRGFEVLWRVRLALGMLGCRRGEMLNLHLKEIHMDTRDPHIQIEPKQDGPTSWQWKTKTRNVRYVALPEIIPVGQAVLQVHRDIVELMEQLPARQPYICLESRYFEHMLKSVQDKTVTLNHYNDPTGNFQRLFYTRQTWAGVQEPKRFHELRAGFLTWMNDRYGLKRAADAAGIVSLQTAARYDRTKIMSIVSDINQKMTEKSYMSYVP
jgi:integrase